MHFPGAGRCGGDAFGRRQRRLDLGQLDPETAYLHLMVGPPGELQLAVLRPAGQVAAAVQPRTRLQCIRIGYEAGRGQAGPLPVAPSQLVAGVVQLAHHPDRHRSQGVVEQVGLRTGDRLAHRGIRRCQRPARDRAGGLGGADVVQQFGARPVGAGGDQPLQQRHTHRLAPTHQPRQGAHHLGASVDQRGHQAGHRRQLRHLVPAHQGGESFGVAVLGVVGENHGGAGGQTGQHLHAAFEEGDRGLRQSNVVGAWRIVPQLPVQPRRHGSVRAHRALRRAGGPRGKHQIHRVVGVRRG